MDSLAAEVEARTAEGHAAFSMRGTDDRWIQIQTNTFTNWVNEQMRPIGVQIQDVHTDFCDGIKLCQLMEVLQVGAVWLVTGRFGCSSRTSWRTNTSGSVKRVSVALWGESNSCSSSPSYRQI